MKTTLIIAFFCAQLLSFSQGKFISYKCDTSQLKGYYVASNPKKIRKGSPAIILLPAWMGITDHEKKSAEELGKLGYSVLVADIYGEKVHPSTSQVAGKLSGFYKTNYKIYQARIASAIDVIKKQSLISEVMVMGYCFGGTGALEAARGKLPVKAVVSFHGGLAKDSLRPNENIQAKVLVLHGADDPYVTEKEIKKFQREMREGNADWQMIYYANAVHAFTDPSAGNDNSKGAAYNSKADKRSWQALLNFLKELEEN